MNGLGKTLGIIQARMGSTRLPGKVLAELAQGMPLLEVLVRRVRSSRRVDSWLLATSTLAANDPLADLAKRLDLPCYRGSEEDVLDRFYQAALPIQPDVVVRLTADNPVVDGTFVDEVVEVFAAGDWDYVAPDPASYPYGMSAEVFRFNLLRQAWTQAQDPYEREHVTPWLYRDSKSVRVHRLRGTSTDGDLRLTVDDSADLERVRRLFLQIGSIEFSWRDAVTLLRGQPIPAESGGRAA